MICRGRVALLLPLFVIMTLSACQSTPVPGTDPIRAESKPPKLKASRPGSRAGAASRDLTPVLDEVEMHLASGDPYLAHVLLRNVDLSTADPQTAARAAAQRVETSVALGLADEAVDWLRSAELDPGESARLRAQICQQRADHRCVFEQLNLVASHADAPESFNDRIWAALVAADSGAEISPASADGNMAGWLALLEAVRNPGRLDEERRAVESWRHAWPDHPASLELPEALRYLQHPGQSAPVVAVLLPLSGQLQPIGRAVRDGMMSAHVFEAAQGGATSLPSIRFIDSSTAPIAELQAQAIADGAQVIIGPVLRDAVASLAALSPGVPVIALNYLEGKTAPANFFQLGIAIEDEARGIREQLVKKGYKKVLFVVSSAGWAERALNEILSGWNYEPILMRVRDSRELTGLVGGALGSTSDFIRKSGVQTITGLPVIFNAGKRHDLDAIVALTDPVQSSTLGPALSYHSIGTVDTYLGTQSFRGAGDVAGLAAILSDLPVMTASDDFNLGLRKAWLGQSAADISFYSLGADAYRLLRRMPGQASGKTRTIWGSSGLLLLGADGSVERHQTLAKFVNGQLKAIPPAK